MLARREIENYLLDFDVLEAFYASRGTLLRANYDAIVTDIYCQDLKAGQTIRQLKILCAEGQKSNIDFKKALAAYLPGTQAHRELTTEIFNHLPAAVTPALTDVATQ